MHKYGTTACLEIVHIMLVSRAGDNKFEAMMIAAKREGGDLTAGDNIV